MWSWPARFGVQHLLLGLCLTLFSAASWAQPTFSQVFTPNSIGPGSASRLTYTITNGAATPALDLAFANVLPVGMTIASAPDVLTDCINAVVTAPAGGSTVTLSNGRLGGNGTSCFLALNVTSSTIGTAMNITGDLTSSLGNSGTATDDLDVLANRPGFTKSFSPGTVTQGQRSTLTFTLDNTLNAGNAMSLAFVDDLPFGMEVADPPNIGNTCGDTVTAMPGSQQISFTSAFPGSNTVMAGAICTITVDILTTAAGTHENVSGDLSFFSIPGPGSGSSGLAVAPLTVNVGNNLVFTKTFTDDPVVSGGQVQLVFDITNRNRNLAVDDIAFTDDLDATLIGLAAIGTPIVACNGGVLSGSNFLTFSGGSLGPNESCQVVVDLQVPAGSAPGEYTNTTSNITGMVNGQPIIDPAASDTLFVTAAPLISKTFLSNPAAAGDTVSMEFSITNSSATSAATDITFTDNIGQFFSGATIASLPAAGFCGAGSTAFTFLDVGQLVFQITGANLAPSASCTFVVDILVPTDASSGDFVNVTSNIIGTVDGASQTGRQATDTLSVIGAPQFTMSFPDPLVAPGGLVDLEFDINLNEGDPAATDIAFTVDLNAAIPGLVATGLPANDVCGTGSNLSGAGMLTFTGGNLASGGACNFSVSLQVPAGAALGEFTLTSSPLSSTVSGTAVSGTATTAQVLVSNVVFTKEFIDDPAIPGETTTLRFTIDNSASTSDVTGMFFTDSLSTALAGLAAAPALPATPCGAGSSVSGTTFLIFVGGNLLAGETCTFDIPVVVPPGAVSDSYLSTTSSLTATVGGSVVVLPPASDSLVVNNELLQFDKRYLNGNVVPGGSVDLEFTITNLSATDAISDIAFTDDIDGAAGVFSVAGLPANDICGVGSSITGTSLLTFMGGNLPAGGSCTFTVTVDVAPGAAGLLFNNLTSSVTGMLAGLPVIGSPASDSIQVSALTFTKAFAGPVVTGQSTTLSYTITNSGTSSALGLRFTDDLEAALTGLVSTTGAMADICGAGSSVTGTGLLSFNNGSLAPGASCTFNITVQVPAGLFPNTFPSVSSELLAGAAAAAAPASADLVVLGQANISVTPASLMFSALVGQASPTQTITVENTGTADLMVTGLTTANAPFSLSGGSCAAIPFTLTAGSTCTLDYQFAPLVSGMANQSIMVDSNGAAGQQSFLLEGLGLQPELSISPATLDFGDVVVNSTSASMMVTLSNNGNTVLAVSSVTAPGAPFQAAGGSCGAAPFNIAAAGNCTLAYEFAPTSVGSANMSLDVVSDAPTSP
ncbi:MAG: choice-of-anchor D domain-containing protein, partial [Xanthomonadales bacterium]|nr:choice-of-anchor D domain-containing protein [Xanthomonadales bacterium]